VTSQFKHSLLSCLFVSAAIGSGLRRVLREVPFVQVVLLKRIFILNKDSLILLKPTLYGLNLCILCSLPFVLVK
jgi:hypothetical protein